MFFELLIVFFSIIFLVILHEASHFLTAKKFGVKVEEFGIGYPPRIIGKRIGETVYSLNLLPFGAFVRIEGEDEEGKDNSFSRIPLWKRAIVISAGVISFWLIAAFLFAIVFSLGIESIVGEGKTVKGEKIEVLMVSPHSPAGRAGIRAGDFLKEMKSEGDIIFPKSVQGVQAFVAQHSGKKVELEIERKGKVVSLSLLPRSNPPPNEGPMGIGLAGTVREKYPFFLSLWKGFLQSIKFTIFVLKSYWQALFNLISRKPTGVSVTGPLGIFQILVRAKEAGLSYFFNLLAMISIYLAVFNALPIPSVDGGRLFFLLIEGLRKKPISPKIERGVNGFFFALLVLLMIVVTIKDIQRIF